MSSINDRVLISLVAFTLYILFVCGDELLLKDESIDRGAHSDRSGLWFGPRLGKRSSPSVDEERDVLQRLLEAAANLKYESDLYEQEQETQKDGDGRRSWGRKIPPGFFTPRPGRSQKERQEPRRRFNNNVDFTPRLGRGLDELVMTDDDLARYYAIRASRNSDFTPRLGRELGYQNSVRVVRSVNRTKS